MPGVKILLSAMSSQGHVNAIIGLAEVLKPKNHELIFALTPAWESLVKSKGYLFEALQIDKMTIDENNNEKTKDENNNESAKDDDKKAPNAAFIDFFNQQLEILRKDPLEALETFSSDKLVSTYWGWSTEMISYSKPLERAIETIKPDVIIVDFVVRFPCLIKSSIPWITLWSCSPVAIYKEAVPPEGSGFSFYSPKEKWSHFRSLYSQKYKPIRDKLNAFLISENVPPYGDYDSFYLAESPHMNVYSYPEALDYTDVASRPDKWYRMDTVIREPDQVGKAFEIPENLKDKPGKLIYFSLGTMGSVDLELMRRVISILAKSPHRFIVSKGPYHEQIDLPDNCWGDRYVNQIAILPYVDLVITHGGNNTLTESLYFGKPLIVMPIFYDQLDNAQRVEDKQLGIRLNTYNFTDDQLINAIEKLLIDDQLREKLQIISTNMKQSKTSEQIAHLIEQTAIKNRNK